MVMEDDQIFILKELLPDIFNIADNLQLLNGKITTPTPALKAREYG